MKKVDRDALLRALDEYCRDPLAAEQIERKRQSGCSWAERAQLAAYSCQCDALNLKPWQFPPCWLSDEQPVDRHLTDGLFAGWELRRRLIALGLSPFEPDPVAALQKKSDSLDQTKERPRAG
jgi:hypothetical protein